jgi:hypothetical protein
VFVLPQADEQALRQVYDAACDGSPFELWRAEDQHGPQVVERLGIVGLVRVVNDDHVVPTFAAAVQLGAREVELARRIFGVLRDEARKRGEGVLARDELARVLGTPDAEIDRAVRILPAVPGAPVRIVGAETGLPLTRDMKRWDGRLPNSPLPQHPILAQLAAMYHYGVRQFRGVSVGSVPVAADLDLRGVTITDSNVARAQLIGVRLDEACIERTDLSGANLTRASFKGATLRDVNFGSHDGSPAELRYSEFDNATLERVEMINVGFADASLRAATLRRVNFGPHDVAGADLESVGFEDNCGFDIEVLRGASWSVIYLAGVPCFPTGPQPLAFQRRRLGWAVIVRGVDHGAVERRGCAALDVLTRHPDCESHVLDLERAELGEEVGPPEWSTSSAVDELLVQVNLQQLADGKKSARLDDVARARLAALLRYLLCLEQLEDGEEIREIRDHVVGQIGTGDAERFPCAGPVEKIRKRAVGRMQATLAAIAGQDADLQHVFEGAFELREFCRYSPAPLL